MERKSSETKLPIVPSCFITTTSIHSLFVQISPNTRHKIMAPALTAHSPPQAAPVDTKKTVPRSIFPDGIKTSGQHPPLYTELRPYSAFPTEITGPTVWTADEYTHNTERWTHHFTPAELSEMSAAADTFSVSGTPLTGISQPTFPLPHMAPFPRCVRTELLNGKGFILFKGFPVQQWGNRKSAIAYMGLGTYLGYFVSQNGKGHVLGHVKDLGEDSGQIDKVRIYRTNARQYFHADDADLVGLLCVARALEGGESDIASAHQVWNVLQRERPDVARTLTQPIWYFDRKGEVSRGEEPYIRTSVFYLERPGEGGGGDRRVYCKYASLPRFPPLSRGSGLGRDTHEINADAPYSHSRWDPYFIRSLSRFSSTGLIPPLSPAQLEAADVLEATCKRFALHMILEVGDIQFLSNEHVLHARTEYTDHAPPAPRRHLMRLWLATPESEGGWRLPFCDSGGRKRGGYRLMRLGRWRSWMLRRDGHGRCFKDEELAEETLVKTDGVRMVVNMYESLFSLTHHSQVG